MALVVFHAAEAPTFASVLETSRPTIDDDRIENFETWFFL
jgi:hypothetical protein